MVERLRGIEVENQRELKEEPEGERAAERKANLNLTM